MVNANVKTVGELRRLLDQVDDGFEVDVNVVRPLSGDPKGLPYELAPATLEFDDVGHSSRRICFSVTVVEDE